MSEPEYSACPNPPNGQCTWCEDPATETCPYTMDLLCPICYLGMFHPEDCYCIK